MELINLYIEEKDESGVSANAVVDNPAIERPFHAFGKEKKLVKHTITFGAEKGNFIPTNGDRQILAGPLMIPDIHIYRNDNGKEYNVRFTRETIEKIVEKFTTNNLNTSLNQMHDNSKPVPGVLYNHFIIDRKLGINPPLGQDDLPDGTWFGFVKIKDSKFWEEFIKTGIYRGFSVEGLFYEEPVLTETESEFTMKILGQIRHS